MVSLKLTIALFTDYDSPAGLHCQSVLADRRSGQKAISVVFCEPCRPPFFFMVGRKGDASARAGSLDPSLLTPFRSITII